MTSTEMSEGGNNQSELQRRVHEVIFEADTPAGKTFDVFLIVCILLSVLAVMVDTVPSITPSQSNLLHKVEWGFTIFFTVEYLLRLWCVKSPKMYATSFFGVIDVVAILPTYLALLFPGAEYMLMIRFLRVLRVFRVLGMNSYVQGSTMIWRSLVRTRAKIVVFLTAILILVTIFGAAMYTIEGRLVKINDPTAPALIVGQRVDLEREKGTSIKARVTTIKEDSVTLTLPDGSSETVPADDPTVTRPFNYKFESIPKSVYWAIVTLTTVGYGDIKPITPFGQGLAALVMIMGYSILGLCIGVIVATEIADGSKNGDPDKRECGDCGASGHKFDAKRCYVCGHTLMSVQDSVPHTLNTTRSCINCGAEGHRLDAQHCHKCGDQLDEAGVDAYKQLFEVDVETEEHEKDKENGDS